MKFFRIDLGIFIPVVVLLLVSLVSLFSINTSLFQNQLLYSVIGILAFLFFSQTNFASIRMYGLPIYILSIILLLAVLFLGTETRGSVRWLEFFGFNIQFSEILKPFLAISLSSFLTARNNYKLSTYLLVFLLLTPIAFLTFIQPDLGNALIYLVTVAFTLLVFGFPLRFFLSNILLALISMPFLWGFLHDYQKQRIFSFISPSDPLGSSYNAIQSVIAVGSGMIFGKGLGLGTQSGLNFLPERHTDFIFAAISEELGIVGSIVIVVSFSFLLYKIFSIMVSHENLFFKSFAICSFGILFFQFFVNIGMNIGILPVVGITLPFVSYGGSSLLSSFIILGLLSSMSSEQRTKEVLEIK
jgi:rod shape determining protein RodA